VSRDAPHFAAAWYTRLAAQITRKIARLAQRQATDARSASGGQKAQTGAKNVPQTSLRASPSFSYIIHSDSLPAVGQVNLV